MNSHVDQRVAELEALAQEEGFTLPYEARYIVWLEDRGRIVELPGGEVYNSVTLQTTASAKAVLHLLSEVKGEIVIAQGQ